MPNLMHFPSNATLPAHYGQQIRDFVRIHWFDTYAHNGPHAPVCPEELHPHYCTIVDGPALLSSATAVWQMIEHAGQQYKTYGLSGVLTYPAFRKKGYGNRVVEAATGVIRADPAADIAVLWTGADLDGFYDRWGWEHPSSIVLHVGARDTPRKSDGHLMMLFLSERARQRRPEFEAAPVYFGPYQW